MITGDRIDSMGWWGFKDRDVGIFRLLLARTKERAIELFTTHEGKDAKQVWKIQTDLGTTCVPVNVTEVREHAGTLCNYCDQWFRTGHGYRRADAKFCCDLHKTAYHSERRSK